jgi:phosphonate transport system substrate-binding protein
MNPRRFLLKGMAFAALFAAVTVQPAPLAAQERIRFAVTDVDGAEALQREFTPFKEAFEKASGLKMDFFPVSGRTAAVEAMAADQVDFVLTGPAEYVVFQARLKAVPVVGWSRPDYFSQIVVLAGGPIKTLNDLKGKKISFGEIGSTSQHLGPAQILVDGGLTYARDYEPVFLRLNVAVEALKQGDIAAIGMNLTHIQRIRQANPGVAFLVLERGRDLPDDILLASPKVPAATLERVRKVFTDQGAQLIHKAVTSTKENAKFVGGTFLPTVTDRDYDIVRSMYRAVGINEFTKFIGTP